MTKLLAKGLEKFKKQKLKGAEDLKTKTEAKEK